MKAAVCYEFGAPLRVEDIEIDPPQRGEVRIRLKACGICHSDIHFIDGAWGGALPSVFGHETAGVVEAVGPDVDGIESGDHVIATLLRSCGECYYCAHESSHLCEASFPLDRQHRLHTAQGVGLAQGLRTGGFAEAVVVDQSQVEPIPDDMPFESAALLGCAVLTGWGAVVNTARVPVDSSVAVLGAGGVGLNALQAATLAGADPVIAIDPAADKRVAAAGFGATHAFDAATTDLPAAVRGITANRGVDYAFVTVGSSRVIGQALRLVRPGGAVVLVGMPASGDLLQLEASELAGHGQRIIGSKMGSASLKRDIPRLIDLYRSGRFKLDELVSGRYRIEEINQAIAAVKQGQALRNVILF